MPTLAQPPLPTTEDATRVTRPDRHPPADWSAESCAECARLRHCDPCFEELVRRFQVPLLHFLSRRMPCQQDALDVLQETLLAAYRNLHRYRTDYRFSTWLFTIAHRNAISHRRRRSVAHATFDNVQAHNLQSPDSAAETIENRSRLWDAARTLLDADAFTALWLCYVESMSAEQIGQVIHRNANAVRILLHRTRQRLAQSLGPEFSGVLE